MDGRVEYLKLPIIVDIGSGEIKAGFSGEENPKVIFLNIFREPKYKKILRTLVMNKNEMTNSLVRIAINIWVL